MPHEGLLGVEVLVAAHDANFLRLAAAVLTRAGHTVRTTTDRLGRVERLMHLHRPDVLVLEADHHRILEVRARVPATMPRAAIVLVLQDTGAPSEGADAVIAKWGPPAHLLAAVRRALAATAGDGTGAGADAFRPRLRLLKP